MKLFNSLNNKIEEFKTIKEKEVSMYVCGPTVYNYPHIGNARPIIVFDTLLKTLEAIGYKVKFVSNFTDVDDKIINAAIKENVDENVITEKYMKAYNEDRLSLNAKMPDFAPKVTETMTEIINFIKLLVDEGYGYEIDGDVYFRVSKMKDYGILSNQKIDDLLVGARIDENDKKENPLDFTLWKKTNVGINWDSPFSKGRPGWHSECVVMINNEFDQHLIDIHGGGMDLKFPHHENEIAQSIAAYNTPIANYWLHNGMVNIDGVKMSKSIGNVLLVKDLVHEYGGNVLRWMMLSAQYRSPLNISDEVIETAKIEIDKIRNSFKQADVKLALINNNQTSDEMENTLWRNFIEVMEDDLNTPNGFKALFDANKALNNAIRNKECDPLTIIKIENTMDKMLYVLGIKIEHIKLSEEDIENFTKWNNAKKEKKFDEADKYREVLINKGLI